MSNIFTLEDFKKASDFRKSEKVEIEGKVFYIYELTGKDVLKFKETIKNKNVEKNDETVDLISKIVCDDKGNRIIPEENKHLIYDFPISWITKILEVINKLSNVSKDIDDAEKN